MRKKYTMNTIKKFVLLSALVFGFALIVSFFSFVDQAMAECPSVEFVCDNYPPMVGVKAEPTGGWCEGKECIKHLNHGAEIKVIADDEEGSYPLTWHVIYKGTTSNISCEPIIPELDTRKWYSDTIVIPEIMHRCMIALDTENETYLEFFASQPNSECLGWVECQIIDAGN